MEPIKSDVKHAVYLARIRRGWSKEQALGLECPPNKKQFNGNWYSIAELSRIHPFKVNRSTIWRRFELNWSVDRVMNTPTAKVAQPTLGYDSRTSAAKANGIKLSTVSNRVMRGMAPDAAVLFPLNHDGFEAIQNDGYGEIYVITVLATGLKYVGLTTDRLRRKKMHLRYLSKATAMAGELYGDMLIHGQTELNLEFIESVKTKALLAQREKYWINKLDTFRNGYNKSEGGELGGWSGNPVAYKGILYPNIRFACKHIGVPYGPVCSRINSNNMEFDEAVNTVFSSGYWYDDIFFGNCADLARATGTKSSTLYKCLCLEEEVEMAVERAKQIKLQSPSMRRALTHGTKIIWNSTEFLSIPLACSAVNASEVLPKKITPGHIFHFMKKMNITAQKSLDMIISGEVSRFAPVTVDNVPYRSVNEACQKLKISYSIVKQKISLGSTPSDAIAQVLRENKGKNKYHKNTLI